MTWEVLLTSDITAAVVGSVAGSLMSYLVSRRLQLKEHEFQQRQEERKKAEGEEAWRRSVLLNRTQNKLLQFCRDNPSQRYNLQSGSGTHWLLSVDTEENVEIPDMTIGKQLSDMEDKGYINTLKDTGHWHIFELTEQGRELDIFEAE